LATHQGDARLNTHVENPFGVQQSAMIARLKNAQLKTNQKAGPCAAHRSKSRFLLRPAMAERI
jgi:hypothetical protein